MVKMKRVDIDNMDEFLSIELDKNITVGNVIAILDIEYKRYVSSYTNRTRKYINKKEHKLKRNFLNTAKMLIDNKDKLDINIIDILFIYRLGYVSNMIFKHITKRDNLKPHNRIMLAQKASSVYEESYNKHKGLLKEDFIKHQELLFFTISIKKGIYSIDSFDNIIYKEIVLLSNVELDYNNVFQNIDNSLMHIDYNISININQEDEYDLNMEDTIKINRLELFSKLYHDKEYVATLFKIIDTYGKNSNFFKILEGSSVVDKTKVDRLKKDIDTAMSRAIECYHNVTEYRERINYV